MTPNSEPSPDLPTAPTCDLSQLQGLAPDELGAACADLEIAPGLTRTRRVFELTCHRLGTHGVGRCEGVLDVVADGFGFLRSARSDYRPSEDDIYVSPAQIRRLNLRTGHVVAGRFRAPKRGENYLALQFVEAVQGRAAEEMQHVVPFSDAIAVRPHRRLPLSRSQAVAEVVPLVDRLAPVGLGQRIVASCPSARDDASDAIITALVDSDAFDSACVCLIDQRPEDAATRRRAWETRATAITTHFDAPPDHHSAAVHMALGAAKRVAESGGNALLVVDSLTALTRAHNLARPGSGKILVPGLDSSALRPVKELLAAARSLEGAGSLTVLGVLCGESPFERAIANELLPCANATYALVDGPSGTSADPVHTRTRNEDLLIGAAAARELAALRAELTSLPPERQEERLRRLARDAASAT